MVLSLRLFLLLLLFLCCVPELLTAALSAPLRPLIVPLLLLLLLLSLLLFLLCVPELLPAALSAHPVGDSVPRLWLAHSEGPIGVL